MAVARGDAVALTRELVRIDSRNPSLVVGGAGEHAVAAALSEILSAWGFGVEVRDAAPGRPNVVARIGPPGTRS
ncbi:MAG: acetylornithine deacetylase, partial [Gemmatimonadaceae bacterium]